MVAFGAQDYEDAVDAAEVRKTWMHKLVPAKNEEKDRKESLRKISETTREEDWSLFEVWPNEGRGPDSGSSHSS